MKNLNEVDQKKHEIADIIISKYKEGKISFIECTNDNTENRGLSFIAKVINPMGSGSPDGYFAKIYCEVNGSSKEIESFVLEIKNSFVTKHDPLITIRNYTPLRSFYNKVVSNDKGVELRRTIKILDYLKKDYVVGEKGPEYFIP